MSSPRVLITGGAGFLGSHLTDRLIEGGSEVLCVDNLLTGRRDNVAHLLAHPRFRFIEADVCEYLSVEGPLDLVLHFASAASPKDYLEFPIHTLKVGAVGTHRALGLAKAKGARFLLASTSEVYGDPLVSPQPETYWGNVNPISPRGVYDEAKRFAEAMTMAYHRYSGLDTRVARIFNSILADQPVLLFNDETLHLEPIEEYAKSVALAPNTPRRVLVPAFDPKTCEITLSPANALIRLSATHQDAFELRLRYGRSVKVTGDHSVFVKGPDGRPLAKPVRQIVVGDRVAIPARLPVVEVDRAEIDLPAELLRTAENEKEGWRWAVRHPSFSRLIKSRREEIHDILTRSRRYSASRRERNTIVCLTKRWMSQGMIPLPLLRDLGVSAPPGTEISPSGGTNRFLPGRLTLDEDMLWLCGFFLAEGCVYSSAGTHVLTFSSNEGYLLRALSIIQERFGIKGRFIPPTREHAPSVYFHSRLLTELFRRVLRLKDRRIPAWVMQLPLSRVKHFLEGYRCGDGTHSGKLMGKRLEWSTKDEQLAVDLCFLLLRFGILASLGRYQTTFKARYGERRFPFWRVTICKLANWDILAWDEGVQQTLNAERTGDLIWSQVREVRPCVLTGHVYDFSVPGKENFVAGSGVSCHNTYGPRMRPDDGRAIANFCVQALRGEPITVFGDGSQTRSFCYLDDMIDGLTALIEAPSDRSPAERMDRSFLHTSRTGEDSIHQPINLGNPDERSVLEIARLVLAASASRSEITFAPLPVDDPRVRRPDVSRATRLLGWEPRIGIEEGIRRTVSYFRSRLGLETVSR